MPEGETLEFDREKRCIWCSLPKFGDNACVCDDPSYEMMEQCSRCETWREVDQLHIADGGSEDVVCTARCMMTDGGQSTGDTNQSGRAMQIGKKATVQVSIVMEYTAEVEMPVNGDPGEQADFELFCRDEYDDYDEKIVANAEILDEEPIYEDERDKGDWPTHV